MLQAPGLPQLLEPLRPQHLSQRVGGIDRTVDEDVGDVDALGRELCVEGLAEHASPAHGRGVGVLPRVSPHRGRGGCHQDRSPASLLHEGADGRGDAKEPEGREPPAQLERLVAGVLQCPVADLGAQVEGDDLDRADVRLDGSHAIFSILVNGYRGKLHLALEAFDRRDETDTPAARRVRDVWTHLAHVVSHYAGDI